MKTLNLIKTISVDGSYQVDKSLISDVLQNSYYNLSFQLPLKQEFATLNLTQTKIFTKDFKVTYSDGIERETNLGVHYRGKISGNESSSVSLSFTENGIVGMVMDGFEHYQISSFNNESRLMTLNSEGDPNFICENDDETDFPEDGLRSITPLTLTGQSYTNKCVSIFWESEPDIYQYFGSETGAFLTSLFNASATLFANDNITVNLSELFIWTSGPTPYSGTSTSTVLSNYRYYRNISGFNGDLAHWLSIDRLSGGRAYIDSLCTTSKYAVSTIFNFFSIPNAYSWSVNVVTHEQGHSFGSYHTHAPRWNSPNNIYPDFTNGTQIDGCGPICCSLYNEGGTIGPLPPLSGGTIMSYCHLLNGTNTGCLPYSDAVSNGCGTALYNPQPNVRVNFNLGFGPQPKQAMINIINGKTCTLCNGCEPVILNSDVQITISGSTIEVVNLNFANPRMWVWDGIVSNTGFLNELAPGGGVGDFLPISLFTSGKIGLSFNYPLDCETCYDVSTLELVPCSGTTTPPLPTNTPTKTPTSNLLTTPTQTPTKTKTPTVTKTQGLVLSPNPTSTKTPTVTPTKTKTPSVTPTKLNDCCDTIYGPLPAVSGGTFGDMIPPSNPISWNWSNQIITASASSYNYGRQRADIPGNRVKYIPDIGSLRLQFEIYYQYYDDVSFTDLVANQCFLNKGIRNVNYSGTTVIPWADNNSPNTPSVIHWNSDWDYTIKFETPVNNVKLFAIMGTSISFGPTEGLTFMSPTVTSNTLYRTIINVETNQGTPNLIGCLNCGNQVSGNTLYSPISANTDCDTSTLSYPLYGNAGFNNIIGVVLFTVSASTPYTSITFSGTRVPTCMSRFGLCYDINELTTPTPTPTPTKTPTLSPLISFTCTEPTSVATTKGGSWICNGVTLTHNWNQNVGVVTYDTPYFNYCQTYPTQLFPGSSLFLGVDGVTTLNGPFTYYIDFSVPVNNVQILYGGGGTSFNQNLTETFIFTTNTGIPTINPTYTCLSEINGNVMIIGSGSTWDNPTLNTGSGRISIENTYNFTRLTIQGDGGSIAGQGGGTFFKFCVQAAEPDPQPCCSKYAIYSQIGLGVTGATVSILDCNNSVRFEVIPLGGQLFVCAYDVILLSNEGLVQKFDGCNCGCYGSLPVLNDSVTYYGTTITTTGSGVATTKILNPFSSSQCQNTFIVEDSVILGFNVNTSVSGPFVYTMNFSKNVNNIEIVLAGSDLGENFTFTSNGGVVSISSSNICGYEIIQNVINTTDTIGLSSSNFIISAPSSYNTLTVTGPGGPTGTFMSISICSLDIQCDFTYSLLDGGTPTPTSTNNQTPTVTPTNSQTPTKTPTVTKTPTTTSTPTKTKTSTPTNTPTKTSTTTPNLSPNQTPTTTSTPTPTKTQTPTRTKTPSSPSVGGVSTIFIKFNSKPFS